MSSRLGMGVAWIACVAAAPLLFGCEKVVRNMYDQPKYKPLAASTLWPDGAAARPLEPGVVVRSAGTLAAASSGRGSEASPEAVEQVALSREESGTSRAGRVVAPAARTNPLRLTGETLRRGRQRYDIYCAPCHSVTGDGDGMVVRRGFPAPATLHSERMRAAPDSRLYDVITEGYGVMYPFADRIGPADRWAIVAYMRALQLSEHARLDDVPAGERAALTGVAR